MEKSRIEQILRYGLGEVSTLPPNLSRIEKLLVKLIGAGTGGGNVEVDSEFSDTSTNPVQNRIITEKFNTLEGDGEGSIYRMIAFEIAKIVAEAPDSLNTLQEIATWIADHEEDAAAMNLRIQNNTSAIESKVDKVYGKQLSTEDYTSHDKEKLSSLTNYDDTTILYEINNIKSELHGIGSQISMLPYRVNTFTISALLDSTNSIILDGFVVDAYIIINVYTPDVSTIASSFCDNNTWGVHFVPISGNLEKEITVTIYYIDMTSELEGTLPLTFRSDGLPLVDYRIYGNTVQNGTPSPTNSVKIQAVGVYNEDIKKYVIPVTMQGQTESVTTDIYLDAPLYGIDGYSDVINFAKGTVTRNLGVFVFTGNESGWTQEYNTIFRLMADQFSFGQVLSENASCICTHYETQPFVYSVINLKNFFASFSSRFNIFGVRDETFSNLDEFTDYLADQYKKGTPMTVVYPLATPVTEKIELPKIPTFKGENDLAIETEIRPDKVYIRYKK